MIEQLTPTRGLSVRQSDDSMLCAMRCALTIVPIALYSGALPAQVTSFVTVDVPGASLTRPTDVNNLGTIVGRFDDANGIHGFVLDHGSYTAVDFPGSNVTTLIGINDGGDVVGRYVAGGVDHGFLLTGGRFVAIDYPGAIHTQCHGINGQGQIVGRYLDWQNPGKGGGGGRQIEHGFLYNAGVYTSIDYPQADTTDGWKITDLGTIVGDWSNSGSLKSGAVHGYVYDGASFTSVDVPGALLTASREVNARGQMIGIIWDKKFIDHGFVRIAGSYGTFDYPGATRTFGSGINDGGEVVGSYLDTTGAEHGWSAMLQRD
jgi:hypothetical protein